MGLGFEILSLISVPPQHKMPPRLTAAGINEGTELRFFNSYRSFFPAIFNIYSFVLGLL